MLVWIADTTSEWGQILICETIEITLLEIIHRDNVNKNLGRGFFVSRIVKVSHSMNLSYCINTICSIVFYKNPFLKGDNYIHEIPSPHSRYISTLCVDHHPSKCPTLENSLFVGITIHQRD